MFIGVRSGNHNGTSLRGVHNLDDFVVSLDHLVCAGIEFCITNSAPDASAFLDHVLQSSSNTGQTPIVQAQPEPTTTAWTIPTSTPAQVVCIPFGFKSRRKLDRVISAERQAIRIRTAARIQEILIPESPPQTPSTPNSTEDLHQSSSSRPQSPPLRDTFDRTLSDAIQHLQNGTSNGDTTTTT